MDYWLSKKIQSLCAHRFYLAGPGRFLGLYYLRYSPVVPARSAGRAATAPPVFIGGALFCPVQFPYVLCHRPYLAAAASFCSP